MQIYIRCFRGVTYFGFNESIICNFMRSTYHQPSKHNINELQICIWFFFYILTQRQLQNEKAAFVHSTGLFIVRCETITEIWKLLKTAARFFIFMLLNQRFQWFFGCKYNRSILQVLSSQNIKGKSDLLRWVSGTNIQIQSCSGVSRILNGCKRSWFKSSPWDTKIFKMETFPHLSSRKIHIQPS